ncbi:protein BLISTER isoform X2 [Benincasa hispida]|uniref:protein BLISTER isoform X2 n=1 Tax=Benincasa hispida TaxID=102211 RepID=UPI0018FF51E8|nr:protein BLISTER isoform X2 [Benincasa hispida]
MASAQVLPNSMASTRKLEHLEAGKRRRLSRPASRLEEFRKKKAAERVKKAAPLSQNHISDAGSQEKKPLESEHAQRITDSDGATTTNGAGRSGIESSSALIKDDRPSDNFSRNIDQNALNEKHASYPFSRNGDEVFSADRVKQPSNGQEIKTFNGSRPSGTTDVNSRNEILDIHKDSEVINGPQARISFQSAFGINPQASEGTDSIISQSAHHGVDGLLFRRESQENSILKSSGSLHKTSANISPQNTVGNLQDTDSSSNNILDSGYSFQSSYDGFFNSTTRKGYSSHEARENVHRNFEFIDNQTSDLEQRKPIDVTDFTRIKPAFVQSSESAGLNADIRTPSNYEPPYTASSENSFRRSRPSFLDSLTAPKAPSGSFLGHAERDKEPRISDEFKVEKDASVPFSFQNPIKSDGLRTDERDGSESLTLQKPLMNAKTVGTSSDFTSQNTPVLYSNSFPPPVFSVKGVDQPITGIEDNTMERKHELYSSKQNEDFAALEQHIEDLTQEKFSLQRALEASRTLAESLAAENSSLTDSYNKQRSVVNQLKSDMEMLQEEMKTQMVELESIKLEYANAQLECNAADERAKLIASEVIGLEEKALRLRSNELKLERQLENLEAEISSYKKKMSSMEKERHDFQSTIDALQEEKKLLQSKLRKASASGKSIDISNPSNRKDMATSTEDLDTSPSTSNHEVKDGESLTENDTSGTPMLLENATTEVSSVIIPPDHMRMIHNINALIAELAVEKEELTQALASELASSSRLKELNKELSRKLEAQTQRLELLTAQSMAGEIVPMRLPDSRTAHEDIVLADEGDEVVERVLGWIMKLFPGGPSRRRTSKLL